MARTKATPVQRTPSEIHLLQSNGTANGAANGNGKAIGEMLANKLVTDEHTKRSAPQASEPGVLSLIISVGGIYASFLTWAVLQERITTTTYGSASSPRKFHYAVFLNTVQSFLAAISGFIYLYFTTQHPHRSGRPAPIFPSLEIVKPLILVAITSSLASPFGYAALNHIDYITFILAKSCKLLPVMFLHITLYGRRYPFYKYAVVILVTLGVAVFTLYAPSAAAKAAKHNAKTAGSGNRSLGLALLSVNLLFDGLTNTVQDDVFKRFKPYSGPQMMCALNILATGLTCSFLFLAPYLAASPIGKYLPIGDGNELSEAWSFVKAYPAVGWDVVGFGLCGAVGQIFIYHTLSQFGSLLLVTVTVTRKMLTMVLSVVWFGHKITPMQGAGVGLVFSGIGGEAIMNRREKIEKDRITKARMLSEAGKDREKAGFGKKLE